MNNDQGNKKRKWRRLLSLNLWRKITSVLMAVVVFLTTYMMILPALTIDLDTAFDEPGMQVAVTESKRDLPVAAGSSMGDVSESTASNIESELAAAGATQPENVNSVIHESVEDYSVDAQDNVEPAAYTDESGVIEDIVEVPSETDSNIAGSETNYYEEETPELVISEESAGDDSGQELIPYDEFEQITAESSSADFEVETEGLPFEEQYTVDETAEPAELFAGEAENTEENGTENTETAPVHVLKAEGTDYRVTVSYTNEAEIPENAVLQVTEILSGENDYDTYVNEAANAFSTEERIMSVDNARFFDITILDGEVPVEPKVPVTVVVELADSFAASEDATVIHYKEDEVKVVDTMDSAETAANPAVSAEAAVLESGTVETSTGDAAVEESIVEESTAEETFVEEWSAEVMTPIAFETDSFSVYGFVTATIEKTILASDGLNYKVTASYGPETGIPEGAELVVEEILPSNQNDENTSSVYDEYVSKTENVLGMEEGSTRYIRLFDICIIDKNEPSIKYQPGDGTAVDVRIDLADAGDTKDLSVVHFADAGAAGDVVNADITDQTVEFKASGFSVYAVADTIVQDFLSDSGVLYEVKVTYGPEARIPEDARLKITEFANDSEDYDYARRSVLADKLARGETVDQDNFGLAALDISILDSNGNKIEPEAAVQVDIRIKGLPGVEDLNDVVDTLELQHHVETEDGVIVEQVSDAAINASFRQRTDAEIIETGGQTAVDPAIVNEEALRPEVEETVFPTPSATVDVEFKTISFSTYTWTWYYYYNRRYYTMSNTIHYGYMSGNRFYEFPNGTPAVNYNSFVSAGNNLNAYYMIYDVDGYEYSHTGLNSPSGTGISPVLYSTAETQANYRTYGYVDFNSLNILNNNDQIYVVYTPKAQPTTGGTVEIDPEDETWPDNDGAPQFTKSSVNNNNGTNTISLSIGASEKQVEKDSKADVIVIFDTSGSMNGDMNGYVTDNDSQRRLTIAKNAVNSLASGLLSKNSGGKDLIRMALISFDVNATIQQGFTTNYNTFRNKVNGLTAQNATNWEGALRTANEMAVESDRATFVIFVTDGDPTIRNTRTNLTNAQIGEIGWADSGVFGTGEYDDLHYNAALPEAQSIVSHNKTFYTVGISNDVTRLNNFADDAGAAGKFTALNQQELTDAFDSIASSINTVLGFGNVEITDGITELTHVDMKVMQEIDPASFKYYRYGGANNKYGADAAHKTEWTTRAADGCGAADYSDGAVHWNMGEGFQLEDGVTYVVEFLAWPSQNAYDLVADLNNGIKTFAGLTDAEKAQVVEVEAPTATTTGTYALKTNTETIQATYNKTTKSGDTVTFSDETDVTADYHELTIQNMALDSDYITVQKIWHNALDERAASGVQLTVTKDGAVYLSDSDLLLNDQNNWTSDKQYISAGFITTTSDGRYNVREPGHDYTVTEPASFSYYWELTADVYRPMVVDGSLKMLIKTDSPTGTEGQDYYVIGGKNYQAGHSSPTLVAQNDRRSNLNLKKLVTANTQAVDKVPNPDDVFTYTIKITDVNGDDVWFSAQDENETTVLLDSYSQNVTPAVDSDSKPTGSYSVPSGEEFTISIKAGLNVRFFNLPKGTTYSIQETGMEDGYEFIKAETSAEVTKPEYADDFVATPGTVNGNTVTGTIDMPNNVYNNEYTNNWNPDNEIVIIKTDEKDAKLAGAQFKLSKFADDDTWSQIATFTSGSDTGETLKVGRGLYKLEELNAPGNYTTVGTVYFKIVTNGNNTTVSLTDDNGTDIDGDELSTVYPDITTSGNEITIRNWPMTSVEARKAWKNADGSTTAPVGASVIYTLYADGEVTDYRVTLDGTADAMPSGSDTVGYESAGWTAKFGNLPKYKVVEDRTTEIEYTVDETFGYPGYSEDNENPVANGETITNTQDDVEIYATKAWLNADNSTKAPDGATVVFTLLADGERTEYTVTLDGTPTAASEIPDAMGSYESEAWKATFVHQPKYKADGVTEIKYTIEETTGYESYAPDPTTAVNSGETITNKQIRKPIEIKKIGDWSLLNVLSGVKFKIFTDKACTDQMKKDSTGTPIGMDGLIITGTDGTALVGSFIPGTYYLKEVETAPGYNLLTDAVEFTVRKDGTLEYSTGSNLDYSEGGSFYELKDKDGFGIYINNDSGAVLPMTGGPGTLSYELAGIVLVISAALIYSIKSKRRKNVLF